MPYEVVLKEVAPQFLAGVRRTSPVSELGEIMPRGFSRIMSIITKQGLQPTGGAVAIYHGWTQDAVDVEIGFTVATAPSPEEGVAPGRLPGGRVLFTTHVGPYRDIEPAYRAIQEYADRNGLVLGDLMWEQYLTDPAVEPDPSRHVTEVYWPLG